MMNQRTRRRSHRPRQINRSGDMTTMRRRRAEAAEQQEMDTDMLKALRLAIMRMNAPTDAGGEGN